MRPLKFGPEVVAKRGVRRTLYKIYTCHYIYTYNTLGSDTRGGGGGETPYPGVDGT